MYSDINALESIDIQKYPKLLIDYVNSEEFKTWFGEWDNKCKDSSKIINQHGYPMLVYHGTEFGGFKQFSNRKDEEMMSVKNAFWFSDNVKCAISYANGYKRLLPTQTNVDSIVCGVYPCFLNVRNCKIIDYKGCDWKGERGYWIQNKKSLEFFKDDDSGYNIMFDESIHAKRFIQQELKSTSRDYKIIDNCLEGQRSTNSEVKRAQIEGYDGCILLNVKNDSLDSNLNDSFLQNEYVVFDSKNIKCIASI